MRETKLVLGEVDISIKKIIRELIDMNTDTSRIYLSIQPLIEVQKDMFDKNFLTKGEVGINLILSKEDYQEYISYLRERGYF